MRIATAAYPIEALSGWAAYEAKLSAWVGEAAGQGARLLVFPEYGAMELAALDRPEAAQDMEAALHAAARHVPAADALHARLAATHGVHILAASAPVFAGARPVNRARFFAPGGVAYQDKQIMTPYERAPMGVVAGDGLRLFETALGRIGVLICYDAEFPLLARALVGAGAQILLVPSCTGTLAGYWRVRVGAMARALEGQCIVVHAPTLGSAASSAPEDQNHGAAAIYGPPDLGFPNGGVIAEGGLDVPGWVYADVDLADVARVRKEGRVLNYRHWGEQGARVPDVTVARISTMEP